MTILALDVGNTHIVLGCVRDGEIVSVARMATQAIKTEDEYAIEISAILMLHGIERRGFDGAIMSDWGSYRTVDAVEMVKAGNCWITPGGPKWVWRVWRAARRGEIDRAVLENNVKALLKGLAGL